MPYAAAYSRERPVRSAIQKACRDIRTQLAGPAPDLSFLFVTRELAPKFEEIAESVRRELPDGHLLGCTAEYVAGGSEEIEDEAGFSLWSASLPGCDLSVFHLEFEQTPDGLVCSGFPEELHNPVRACLMLGDPFTCATDYVIDRLQDEYPGVPLMGGMASAARQPGDNRLWFNDQCVDHGAVGAFLQGGPLVRSIVSQGCRPIGSTFVVTRAQHNIVFELGGKPPLAQFQELFATLPDDEKELVKSGLHLGIAMNEYKDHFARGDFLISNVHGADQNSGAIALGNLIRTGQTVQFHVRDAQTADEDLRHMVSADLAGGQPPQAALLFSCNGRGTRLFPEPNHDASTVRELCGPIPLAGFFAAGELGPVAGRNHIHGFTASVALFE